VFILGAGEGPGWVSRQMRHTSAEMLWQRYARWWLQMARSDGSKAEHWWYEEMRPAEASHEAMAGPMVPEREVRVVG
jgi:hypothetical protein